VPDHLHHEITDDAAILISFGMHNTLSRPHGPYLAVRECIYEKRFLRWNISNAVIQVERYSGRSRLNHDVVSYF
jgi:hypothetical protein